MNYYCRVCFNKHFKRIYFVNDICPKCGRYSSKPHGSLKPQSKIPRFIGANEVTIPLAKLINKVITDSLQRRTELTKIS